MPNFLGVLFKILTDNHLIFFLLLDFEFFK